MGGGAEKMAWRLGVWVAAEFPGRTAGNVWCPNRPSPGRILIKEADTDKRGWQNELWARSKNAQDTD